MIWIILLGYLIGMVLSLAWCLEQDLKSPFYASSASNFLVSFFWPLSMSWVLINILALLVLKFYDKIPIGKK